MKLFAVIIWLVLKGLLQNNVYVMLYLIYKVQNVYVIFSYVGISGNWADRGGVRENFSMHDFFSNYVNVLPIQKLN